VELVVLRVHRPDIVVQILCFRQHKMISFVLPKLNQFILNAFMNIENKIIIIRLKLIHSTYIIEFIQIEISKTNELVSFLIKYQVQHYPIRHYCLQQSTHLYHALILH
jgi:hypothetical protein